jgi:hypothetical protein
MSLAHKLSMELRAAEDRTDQLQAEVELCETVQPAPNNGLG